MKVFFFPIYYPTPHFETELELIQNHLFKGDEVVVMICKGNLKTCFYNPKHNSGLCILCKSAIARGLKILNSESDNLKIINYPDLQVDYSCIPTIFFNIDELKVFKLNNISIGLAAASSLISRINRDHKLDTLKFNDEVLTEVQTSFYLAEVFAKYVIPIIKPDLVYIFNGRISTTAPIVDVCKNHQIDFITHERGGQIGRYWIIKNTIPHDIKNVYSEIEKLWESIPIIEREEWGNKFFKDRRNRVEQGWYSFTKEQKKELLPHRFSDGKRNIVFFNSTIEEFAAVKGWEKPLFLFSDEIDALKSICNYFKEDTSKQFYLRVHPNLKGFDNSQVRDIKKLSIELPNLEIILPESPIDTYSLLDKSDLIITFGSTVGIESVYWGKPSIQLGMSFYNNLNAVYIPRTKEELFNLLDEDLAPKPKELALRYGLWELMHGEKFISFNQTSLTSGTFMGKKIQFSLWAKLGYHICSRLKL